MTHETMQYIGDGIRAPLDGEFIGSTVNIHGRRGKVVMNDAFTITVEWETKIGKNWLFRWIRKFFGKRTHE